MAKRSNNNSAGRRIYGEKPYDANNSFVKKMATKVTDLIPQRSWISKWFNTPGGNGEVTNDGDNPDDQDVEEEALQPPSKRPRIRMDMTHPPGTFNIQARGRGIDNEKLEYTNDQYPDDTITDFLQPSLNSARNSNAGRPFAASTPAIRVPTRTSSRTNLNSLNHQQQQQPQQQQQQQQNNVATNGVDDNSESSESTSGCSSLIPQTNRQEGLSQYINYPFAVKKGLSNDKLSFTNHLQSPKSLSFDGRDSASSRRPSFNYSIVSNGSSSVLSSPFYSGNTTFGGANTITSFRSVGGVGPGNEANEFQLRVPKRTSIRVKPSNSSATSDSSGMSQTAKRILEALEHFSSPLADAKKIPIKTPMTAITSGKKRPREEDDLPNVSNVGLRHLTRELSVPTVPDMLKLKRRQRLQDTTLAVRRIVTAQNEQQQQQQQPPTSSSNVPTSTNSTEYHLRTESEDKKFFGKLRAKAKKKVDVEEPADTVNLSNIPLPITTLPNFNIPLPIPQYKANDELKKSSVSTTKEKKAFPAVFKFSSPLKVTTDSGNEIVATHYYVFSEPIDPEKKTEENKSLSSSKTSSKPSTNFKSTFNSVNCSPATNFMWSGSSTAPRPKEKKVEVKEEKSEGVSVASELKSGSVMDILGKKNADVSSDNVWECSECIIKNHESSDQCIACKARKSESSKKQLSVASNSVNIGGNEGQFGAQFKKTHDKWECSSCLVRNPLSESKCLSCMASRLKTKNDSKSLSSASTKKSSASGFQSVIKSQKNTWECPGCMLKNADNVITCPCCNASKPGLIKTTWKPIAEDKNTDNSTKPWECPSCMVKNKSTDSTCVCCTTPCPRNNDSSTEAAPKVVTAAAPPTTSFGDQFKKPSGNWTCDTCLVSNKPDVTKCVACETLKPGASTADSSDKKPTQGSSMQFSFGVQPTSQFKFGVSKTIATEENKKPENPSNGFTFCVPSNQPATQGFSFGIPKTETTSATSGFTFAAPKSSTEMSKSNSQEGNPPSHGFTFGVPKKTDVKSEEDKKPPAIMFGVPKTESESKPVQPIVFSNPIATNTGNNPSLSTTVSQQQNSATEVKKPAAFSFVPPGSVSTGAVVSSQSSIAGSSSTGQTPFTFSEPKTSSSGSSEKPTINFGRAATATSSSTLSTSGFSFTAPKFSEVKTEPAEKKPAINFGSPAALAPIVFGVAPAAENKSADKPAASPFQIANNQEKTGFAIEKKVPAFGVEVKPTETPAPVFGSSEKSLFNAASSGFGTQPAATPTPTSMFGTGASVFGANNTPGFGTPAATTPSIFSAVKPAETTTAPTPGIFSFGAASTAAPQPAAPSANIGFNFNSPAQKTPFIFSGSAPAAPNPAAQPAAAVPVAGTGFGAPVNFGAPNATTATPTPFTFNPPKADGSSALKQAPATQLPSIFSNNQSSTPLGQQATPAASFTSSTPGPSVLFSFGTPTPGTGTSSGTASSGFNFNAGITPATPTPGGFNFNVGSNTTSPVSFDPNTKPSFNFTGGSAPTAFNALPQYPPRKIKRAVRRMNPNRT